MSNSIGAQSQVEFASVGAAAIYWLNFGFRPIPTNPVTQQPTVEPEQWLNELSAERIESHWLTYPDHQIAITAGDDRLVFVTKTDKGQQALLATEMKCGTLPNLVIKDCDTTLHCFKRAGLSAVKFVKPKAEAAAESIDILTGQDWMVLPPSHGYTLSLAMADNAGDLVEVSEDFIDEIRLHNGRIADQAESPVTKPVPLLLELDSDTTSAPEVPQDRVASASGIARELVSKVKADCGAPLETEAIQALAVLKQDSPADFHRVRADLKQANRNVSLVAINEGIKAQALKSATAATHHGYASDLIERLTVADWAPVGHEGSLFVVDPASGLWVRHPTEALERLVAQTHDGKTNCERRSDYSGIAQHAISLASNDSFFADAPVGVACPDGFYQVVGGAITRQPLSPAFRQRVKLNVTPASQPTPMFDRFMHETFQSGKEGEEAEQRALVQEIAGAILLGIMHQHQKAVQFYDPFGRAGKGTLERLLRQLVPPAFVTAVSPFVWHKEYYVAALAGARLNLSLIHI